MVNQFHFEMNQENEILVQFQKKLKFSNTSIDELILDYDRRRSGLITKNQFENLLASSGMHLTPAQHQNLQQKFVAPNGLINIRKFSESVKSAKLTEISKDEVIPYLIELQQRLKTENLTLHDLLSPYDQLKHGYVQENDFIKAISKSPNAVQIAKTFTRNGLVYLKDLEAALADLQTQHTNLSTTRPFTFYQIAHQLNSKHIQYNVIFSSRDKLKLGKVDPEVFSNTLLSTGIQTSEEEIEEVANYYRFGNQINYLAFVEDVNRVGVNERNYTESRSYEPELNIENLIQNLRLVCKARKLRIGDCFTHTPMILSAYSFSRILVNSNLELSVNEVMFLTNHYKNEQDVVDARQFVNDIEKTEAISLPTFNADDILMRIKDFLTSKRTILTPRFEKFDREKSGEFPISLIGSVLNNLGYLISEQELECIRLKYPGHHAPFVNWRSLDSMIEPEQSSFTTPRSDKVQNKSSERLETTPIEPPKPIQPILKIISDSVTRNSMNLYDEFRALDKTKGCFVQPYQVRSLLTQNFPRLSQSDIEMLICNYGGQQFKYLGFCNDLKFVQNENEKSRSLSASLKQNTEIKFDPNLTQFFKRLKAFTIRNILEPRFIFNRNDPNEYGHVPLSKAQNCFNEVHFYVYPEEMKLLIQYYRDPIYSDRFDYMPIVRILESMNMSVEDVKWTLTPELAKSQIDENVFTVNCQIHSKLIARKKRIEDYFIGCPVGSPIPYSEFVQRLSKIDIVLESVELQMLFIKYRVSDDDTQIEWEKFVKELQAARVL